MATVCFPFSVRKGIWLSRYSTFRIGGPARYFKEIQTVKEAQEVLPYLHKQNIPFIVIGKGSNCLFDDQGFDGFVVYNNIQGKEFLSETLVKVYSGTSFAALGKTLVSSGYSGLEFAVGIPGSVGGAIFMNAGIGKQDVSSVLVEVEVITPEGEILSYPKEELDLGYRTSKFHTSQEFILSATFALTKDPLAMYRMKELLNHRLTTQPYQHPSLGCIFRNPPGSSAGALIDRAGLKGLSIGGAQISEKHGNFIINTGKATSGEVKELIQVIRGKMLSLGVELKEEIRSIPYKKTS